MQDRRKEGRSPAYLGGQITTDRRLISFDCVVRNTSGRGARLVVPNSVLLPEIFELHIPKKNCAYRVRACWRRDNDLGVEVMPLADSDSPIPIAMVRKLKRIEHENANLRRKVEGID